MALSNAERQARYKQRLKDAASPAWIRKDFESGAEARENIAWFREFFGRVPAPQNMLMFSREDPETDAMALLIRMPWPLP